MEGESFQMQEKKSKGEKIKQHWESGTYDNINNSASTNFTSNVERSILTYLKNQYPNNEWTSGGTLKINGTRISRDMYSNKLKICIEYDGIWHFKDIHGQLSTKQLKDRLLNEWCAENDWRIIRISETYWHENKNSFQIIEDVLNLSNSIFLGKEYDTHLND